ncbi:acyl-CoA thioesterase/bile acid-CoA:amino acid N-acyltransferase family protein [Halorussus salinus]|uniref:acyl-CoA thioesterase/bile acid-CoA:amino acid N-acyltransferase family protein n=1 Tax=Halorussus salinus TaxID=1364935 RepID=UPI0010932C77|nr:acyl-CoA thioesterase/bile acid-CoA:amino acid N-acyltransferase family protein [Halorussus salinus]
MISRRSALRCLAAGSLVGVPSRIGTSADERATDTTGELRVSPTALHYDEEFDLSVTGLAPGANVTLTARTADREGRRWASFARFTASSEGVVDLAEHAPDAGTYDGVSPMGLVWSMRPTDGDASIYIPPRGTSDLTLAASVGGQRIGEQTVNRRFGPEKLQVRDAPDGLVGLLFRPSGDGPFPGVVVLHGSGGEPDYGTALMLAAHGYAAFAPQYFGDPEPLPDQLAEVPLEYLQRSADWMRGRPAVREGPVGLLGTSKGAELALLAGATFDWVGAVAAYAPSGVVWAGLTYGGETTSSWTLDGEEVPYVPTGFPPSVVGDYAASWPLGESVSLRPTYEVGLEQASDERIRRATIPVENIDGPVTLVSGEDDRLWPSAELGGIAERRLREHDHPHSVRHLTVESAGHAISFPYQPTTGLTTIDSPLPGTTTALGGSPEGLARAAEESWPVVLSTFEEGLR